MAELSWLDRVRNALFPKLQKRKGVVISEEGYRRFVKWVDFTNMVEALCQECRVHPSNSKVVTRINERHRGIADLPLMPELDAELDRIAQLDNLQEQLVAFLTLLAKRDDELALNACLVMATRLAEHERG